LNGLPANFDFLVVQSRDQGRDGFLGFPPHATERESSNRSSCGELAADYTSAEPRRIKEFSLQIR
jgi:hypothetical protein